MKFFGLNKGPAIPRLPSQQTRAAGREINCTPHHTEIRIVLMVDVRVMQ